MLAGGRRVAGSGCHGPTGISSDARCRRLRCLATPSGVSAWLPVGEVQASGDAAWLWLPCCSCCRCCGCCIAPRDGSMASRLPRRRVAHDVAADRCHGSNGCCGSNVVADRCCGSTGCDNSQPASATSERRRMLLLMLGLHSVLIVTQGPLQPPPQPHTCSNPGRDAVWSDLQSPFSRAKRPACGTAAAAMPLPRLLVDGWRSSDLRRSHACATTAASTDRARLAVPDSGACVPARSAAPSAPPCRSSDRDGIELAERAIDGEPSGEDAAAFMRASARPPAWCAVGALGVNSAVSSRGCLAQAGGWWLL
mmetsp:Transcript_30852/g.91789  ORF Transcript_30852/g.91789 Transcript_30852/m.91789 type:complete len:309 (-) Transcript_30852:3337-4263(-)|eukprot:366278-Chlamydomonas_euryale.AAC.62